MSRSRLVSLVGITERETEVGQNRLTQGILRDLTEKILFFFLCETQPKKD